VAAQDGGPSKRPGQVKKVPGIADIDVPIDSSVSGRVQGRNNGTVKYLESPHGHVIARIRPLKGGQLQGGRRTAGSLGNLKEFQ
jgi:hypothetical protein